MPFASLPGLTEPDAVLISHAHLDHLDLPSLRRIARSARVVLPRGWADLARRAGLRDVVEVEPGDTVTIGDVQVRATFAEHDGRRMPFGRDSQPVGYVVAAEARVYFAGDTDFFEGMRELAGDLDVALLPVAGWGRTPPPGHLNPGARPAPQRCCARATRTHPGGEPVGPGVRLEDPANPRPVRALAQSEATEVNVRIPPRRQPRPGELGL